MRDSPGDRQSRGLAHRVGKVEARRHAFHRTLVVAEIAQEAEFTPKNVQTHEQRVKLVFGVKVSLENPEHELKPGMPADVYFEG